MSMYFWNIEKLKARLAEGTPTSREALPYVIAGSIFLSLGTLPFGQLAPNRWDYANWTFGALISVFGTLYAYRPNGGRDGEDFLVRYFLVGWVVAIRWLCLYIGLLFVGLIAFLIRNTGHSFEGGTSPWMFAFNAPMLLLLVWRIGHHLADVAERRRDFTA